MLKIQDLKVSYGAIEALHGVSLEVRRGEIVTLIGANGAGKTTLLKTLSGLVNSSEGSVVYMADGKKEAIENLPPYRIVELGIAQVPEGRMIFPNLTVRENLDLGAYLRKDSKSIKADFKKVLDLFPRLGERLNQSAGTLSGGEQQMLAIGRALMTRPKLMLMDEPSLGLAPILVKSIFDTIKKINEEGTTILLVEQNAHMALKIAHHGYVLETGNIIMEGDAHRLENDENVKKAYLGG